MKDLIKFFSIITGLFRSIISILLFFAVGFIVFVDNNLYLAAFDLIGITSIARSILKPLSLILAIIAFIINTIVARNIFKAGENGKSHPSNIFFALIFLAIDGFLLITFREKLLFILVGFNGLLLLNSLIGLIGKVRGIYGLGTDKQTKTEYIEINQNNTDNSDHVLKSDEVKLLKNEEVKIDGQTKIKTSQLIEKDTESEEKAADNVEVTDSEEKDSEEKDEVVEKKPVTLADIKEQEKAAKIEVPAEEVSKNQALDKSSEISEDEETSEEQQNTAVEEVKASNEPVPNEETEENKKADDLIIKETNLDDLKKKSHENLKTNKVIMTDNSDMTYDPDLAEDFQKAEDERIYDKSTFVKEERNE